MTTSKKPSHTVYQVTERQGADSFWTRIGAAWIHQDGKGFNIQLNATPSNGKLVIRKYDPKNKEQGV